MIEVVCDNDEDDAPSLTVARLMLCTYIAPPPPPLLLLSNAPVIIPIDVLPTANAYI